MVAKKITEFTKNKSLKFIDFINYFAYLYQDRSQVYEAET